MRRHLLTGLALVVIATPIGAWRLQHADAGALVLPAGERVAIEGTVTIGPRRFGDGSLFTVDTADGRVAVRADAGTSPVAAGELVRVRGWVEPAGEWIAGYLRRLGARSWVRARRIVTLGPGRGGLPGMLDSVRNRAQAAIEESMPAPEAALMRGFVLGDDTGISPATADDFKRSGLAHLLAVSGQNVVLLLVFTSAILIVLGVRRAWRWPALAAVVAVYVPVAGASPSIQRAGIMGLLGLLAASLERPLDRWWALFVAAVATLAWNPLAIGDAGWQLSFAAVAGIAIGAKPVASALRGRLRAALGGARAMLAEGTAITVAATLATAPLMAHHFGTISVTAVPANLLALPAVAPAMWAGMALALGGQISGLPLEPLGWLAGALAGYVEWVARVCAAPDWALAGLRLADWWMVAAVYALIASLIILMPALRLRIGPAGRGGRLMVVASLALGAGIAVGSVLPGPPAAEGPALLWSFETRVLDVGQGDSILLRERDGSAVLVDTGYAGTGADERMRALGVEHLDALVLTHADADHAGNLEGVASSVPIGVVIENGLDRRLTARVRRLGLRSRVVAAGDVLRFGRIRLDVLWPPAGASDPGDEPNNAAIVAVAGWRGFTGLLTADAEAESASYRTPDVDLLKIPHHGSADAGLDQLLASSAPELAVISVGAGNTYGHPTEASLGAIAAAGVPLMRTDTDGEVRIAVNRGAWAAAGG